MTNETSKTETLEVLAKKIARYATEADEKTIEAAKLIREARKRVEAGEAGDITWYSWASSNSIRLIATPSSAAGRPLPASAPSMPTQEAALKKWRSFAWPRRPLRRLPRAMTAPLRS